MEVLINKSNGICKGILTDNLSSLYVDDPVYGGLYQCLKIFSINDSLCFRFPYLYVSDYYGQDCIFMRLSRHISKHKQDDNLLYIFELVS